jgi:hypothetical protein
MISGSPTTGESAGERKDPKRLLGELDRLLAEPGDDRELRDRLEQLAQSPAFGSLTYYWGPLLYRRNRVVFRPFILAHFFSYDISRMWGWKPIKWKAAIGSRLDAWLDEVDGQDDVELFVRLYGWKIGVGSWGKVDRKRWSADLLERFRAQMTRTGRNLVLAKFDLPLYVDQPLALELYRQDADAAREFILKHLPHWYYQRREFWSELAAEAQRRGDEDFYFTLYREQVSVKQWQSDVLELCDAVTDPAELLAKLEQRHPHGWDLDLGGGFFELVRRRKRDVVPYVIKHMGSVWRSWGGRSGYKQLVRLAIENQWWDLWTALIRGCATPKEYNAEIKQLVANHQWNEQEVARRLLMLSGVSREWNLGPFGVAMAQQLSDEAALLLYDRFPELLRGPFRLHVSFGWYNAYPKLTARALEADDEVLIDYLASRACTWEWSGWGNTKNEQTAVAEQLSRYYEQLADRPDEFARRAVAVLGQIPAYSIFNYNRLIRSNRLARLFYARSSAAYLSDPNGVRDLLESPEIHVQALAFRALALDDDRAKQLAAENRDLLQAALLRPLHRKTRLPAFDALANAAVDIDAAREIYDRARQALDLPDRRYPKEQLIGLLGRLLHNWPELRGPQEQPVVYGRSA